VESVGFNPSLLREPTQRDRLEKFLNAIVVEF